MCLIDSNMRWALRKSRWFNSRRRWWPVRLWTPWASSQRRRWIRWRRRALEVGVSSPDATILVRGLARQRQCCKNGAAGCKVHVRSSFDETLTKKILVMFPDLSFRLSKWPLFMITKENSIYSTQVLQMKNQILWMICPKSKLETWYVLIEATWWKNHKTWAIWARSLKNWSSKWLRFPRFFGPRIRDLLLDVAVSLRIQNDWISAFSGLAHDL